MLTVIEIGEDLAQLDAAIDALPDRRRSSLSGPTRASHTVPHRRAAAAPAAPAQRTRTALAMAQPAAHRGAYRIPPHRVGVRVFHPLLRTGTPPFFRLLPPLMKLRMPPYVSWYWATSFRAATLPPISHARGPVFRTVPFAVSAERFEAQLLDLFQMRRCPKTSCPRPRIPAVSTARWPCACAPANRWWRGGVRHRNRARRRVPAHRWALALESIAPLARSPEPANAFRGRARQHKRFEKVQEVLRLRDELARDVDRLNGVAITPSLAHDAVEMWFVRDGEWCAPNASDLRSTRASPSRSTASCAILSPASHPGNSPRANAGVSRAGGALVLLLLARGEWLSFDSYGEIPYRKLVTRFPAWRARR